MYPSGETITPLPRDCSTRSRGTPKKSPKNCREKGVVHKGRLPYANEFLCPHIDDGRGDGPRNRRERLVLRFENLDLGRIEPRDLRLDEGRVSSVGKIDHARNRQAGQADQSKTYAKQVIFDELTKFLHQPIPSREPGNTCSAKIAHDGAASRRCGYLSRLLFYSNPVLGRITQLLMRVPDEGGNQKSAGAGRQGAVRLDPGLLSGCL